MTKRKPELDLEAIRDALASADGMVRYYGASVVEKSQVNAALVAAGLAPQHNELIIRFDREHLAEKERQAAALCAVLAYFEPAVSEAA